VEGWTNEWLEETDRNRVDWRDKEVTSKAYDSLCRRLTKSAEKHIGEKTVWRKWGKSERARDLKHKLTGAGREAEVEDAERREEVLKTIKDFCVNLHKETEAVKRLEQKERARGETDRNAHFRTLRASHWKLKKGTPGVVRDGKDIV
jgi:hypothetical protein